MTGHLPMHLFLSLWLGNLVSAETANGLSKLGGYKEFLPHHQTKHAQKTKNVDTAAELTRVKLCTLQITLQFQRKVFFMHHWQ
jgi:hypothetical protein